MKNMQAFLKQAQEVQKRIQDAQEKLGDVRVTGQAGGGMVKVTITGKGEVVQVELDPSLIVPDDKEVLEDLIAAAFNDAKSEAEKRFAEEMSAITGGALPTDFKLPM